MEQLPRDENFITVGGAVNENDTSDIRPLMVDPATDYLTVFVQNGSEVPDPATMNKRDENFVPTYYGVSTDDGVTPIPIRTDENGYLLVDYLLT